MSAQRKFDRKPGRIHVFRSWSCRGLASTLAAGAMLMAAGCGSSNGTSATGSATGPGSGLPAPSAAGPANTYMGFQTGQLWTAAIDDTKNTFSYQGSAFPQTATSAAAITASGATRKVNGFLNLSGAGNASSGYALEIPGRGVLLRPGDMTTALVVASSQPAKCLPIGGGVAFNLMSMPNLIAAQYNNPPSYGVITAFTNADGSQLNFLSQTQYGLPPGTVVSGPYPSTFQATCATANDVAAITVPATAAFSNPIQVAMGPTGFLALGYSYGSLAGFLQPTAPIDGKALTSKAYLGFMFGSAAPAPVTNTVMPVAFGVQSSNSGSLAGGEFPNDDLTQTPNAEYTITLGTQSSLVNGLFEGASVSVPLPAGGCSTPGTDAQGNPVCIHSALAVAGYEEGNYALYALDTQTNTGYFLYQTGVTLTPPVRVTIDQTPPSFVFTGGTLDLSASVANDAGNAGVDWTATCGAPGACGSFSAAHTAAGAKTTYTAPAAVPTGNSVTVTATSTTDPTKSASITVNVKAPVAIAFQTSPPASLLIGTSAPVAAAVANDPAAQGVDWSLSCGSAGACGTLSLAHTASGATTVFTAPATPPPGNIVTIAATATADPTKQIAAPVTITLPPITVALTPPLPSQAIDLSQSLTATVANDAANKGVDWTVTCGGGNCGSFAPAHTASASATVFSSPSAVPPGSTVTVTAASTADPTKTATATITITAKPVISLVLNAPPPATLDTMASASISALVGEDPKNGGVDWSATCSGSCGSFSAAHTASGAATTYTAPSRVPAGGGAVTIVATSTTDPTKNATATLTITARVESALAGKVMANGQPVNGATVSLYTPGTAGYGSAATQLTGGALILTGKDGAFSIPASYICSSPAEPIYLLATGGDAGGGSNAALALISALGPCNSLSTSTTINPGTLTVNEATTVASVYALSAFMNSATNIGASAGNALGLGNAFAQVTNLVDLNQGTALSKTPAGNGTPPQAEIDTLANILSACASTNGSGTACSGLFSAATPTGGTPPTDLAAAVLSIARNANSNIGAIFALAPANGPFQPALAAAPLSWVLPVTYTGAGMIASVDARVDGQGNVWTTNDLRTSLPLGGFAYSSSVGEVSAIGTPLSPSATATSNGGFYADSLGSPTFLSIDPQGNAWTLNISYSNQGETQNDITEFSSSGALLTPPGGLQTGGLGIDYTSGTALAVDGGGNVWISSTTQTSIGDGLIELSNSGFALSPPGGYMGAGLQYPQQIAFDNNGNAWVANQYGGGSSEDFVEFAPNGTVLSPSSGYSPSAFGNAAAIAIDNLGNVWATTSPGTVNGLVEVAPDGTPLSPSNSYALPGPGIPVQLAIDGANTLWVSTFDYLSNTSALFQVNPDGSVASPITGSYPVAGGVAVDGSGNVWGTNPVGGTYDANNNYLGDPLIELVGAATPVVTPLSKAVQMHMVASRP